MPADRLRTEADQWRALQRIKRNGNIKKEAMAAFRRSATTRTGWSMKRLDAWLAGLAKTGRLRTPITATAERREAMLEGAMDGSEAEQAAMMRRVRKHVRDNTEGWVSAAQVNTMKANLRGLTRSKMGVEAALAALEQAGEIAIEDRIRGKGGASRTEWREEARQWARARGWTLEEAAPPKQAPFAPKESIVVELGTGWEGATEGLKGAFDRVISMDLSRQTMEARGGRPSVKSVPDLLTPFEVAANHPDGAATWALMKGGGRQGELAAIWASPSCKEGSVAQGLNKGKQGGAGPHAGKQLTTDHIAGVRAVLEAITKARSRDPAVQYCVEQPAASAMKDMPEVQATLGEGIVVSGCAWGERKSKKPYRLWLSPETAEVFQPIHPASAQSRCEACKGGRRHAEAMVPARGGDQKRVKLVGMTNDAARNRVPPRMAEHVGLAMRMANLTTKEAQRKTTT
jgi:hypothetical protein